MPETRHPQGGGHAIFPLAKRSRLLSAQSLFGEAGGFTSSLCGPPLLSRITEDTITQEQVPLQHQGGQTKQTGCAVHGETLGVRAPGEQEEEGTKGPVFLLCEKREKQTAV